LEELLEEAEKLSLFSVGRKMCGKTLREVEVGFEGAGGRIQIPVLSGGSVLGVGRFWQSHESEGESMIGQTKAEVTEGHITGLVLGEGRFEFLP
jgi:hypothetical protein